MWPLLVSASVLLVLVLLECRLFSHINLPQAQNFTQMKPEARSSSGMDSNCCSVGRLAWPTGKCVFSLSAVEAATVAKEILILIQNARSTQTFCTQFSHFRVFVFHECVHMCVSGARCSLLVCVTFFPRSSCQTLCQNSICYAASASHQRTGQQKQQQQQKHQQQQQQQQKQHRPESQAK